VPAWSCCRFARARWWFRKGRYSRWRGALMARGDHDLRPSRSIASADLSKPNSRAQHALGVRVVDGTGSVTPTRQEVGLRPARLPRDAYGKWARDRRAPRPVTSARVLHPAVVAISASPLVDAGRAQQVQRARPAASLICLIVDVVHLGAWTFPRRGEALSRHGPLRQRYGSDSPRWEGMIEDSFRGCSHSRSFANGQHTRSGTTDCCRGCRHSSATLIALRGRPALRCRGVGLRIRELSRPISWLFSSGGFDAGEVLSYRRR